MPDGTSFAMRKTNLFWGHICLYLFTNIGAFYFYVLPGQSAVVRWLLAQVIFYSSLLLAAHSLIYTRKNSRQVAKMEKYCSQAEEELRRELQAGQRKTHFIMTAYHEVRGHFWGIFAIIRIVAKANVTGCMIDINKMQDDLLNGCHNLELLLSNILDYAKYESGISETPNYAVIDLRQNLAELIDIARYPASERKVRIEYHVSDEIPDQVVCDRVKINQVVTNLVNNAIKFSNPGGDIVVRLQRDFNRWRISIKDQGKGIPRALLPNIFDLFVTTRQGDKATGGPGIGFIHHQAAC